MRVVDRVSEFWLVIYLIMLIGSAVGATIFPLLYSFMVRWWENPLGRYMMYKGIVLASALDLIVCRLFLPELPLWVSFVVMGSITIMVWWYTILFVITYVKGRKKKKREDRQQEEVKEDHHGPN